MGPDGSQRWEQAVTTDVPGWFYSNVSFANGAAWVRNTSNELIAIDGVTGRPSAPIRVTAALGEKTDMVASTTKVVIVSTGGSERSLRAIAR